MDLMIRFAKKCLSIFVTALLLTSCVNYHGINPQAKLLTQQSLITQQSLVSNPLKTTQASTLVKNTLPQWPNNAWWESFHDPMLNQIISLSLATHPDIQLAEARVRLAIQLAHQADANSGATLIGTGEGIKQRFSATSIYPPPIGGVWFNFADIEADFNYDFDFWHKNQQTLAAALGNEQSAEANEASAKLILSSAIAQTYFQILGQNTELSLAQKNLANQIALTQLLKLQAHTGIISTFPVEQATQSVASAQMAVTQLQSARQLSIDQLNALVTIPVNKALLNSVLTKNAYVEALPNTIPLDFLARRPDLMALRWSVEADSHQIKAAQAAFYPDINLMGVIGSQSIGFDRLFEGSSNMGEIGPAFNLPLFDAGRLRANLGITDAQYDIAVDQYNQGLLKAVQQTADALTQLQSIISQETEQSDLLLATQKNEQYVSARFHAGTTDALDYLRTQQTVLQQQQQAAQLHVQHLAAEINLIQALGGGYKMESLEIHNANS